MRRAAVFLVLLLLFVLWTFPHRRVVEHLLATRLGGVDVAVSMGGVAPSFWPPGYRLADVHVSGPGYSLGVEALRLGLMRGSGFRADVCGGSLVGNVSRIESGGRAAERLALRFDEVDPSACLDLGSIQLSGSFHGSAALEGLGAGPPGAVLGRAARGGELDVEGVQGVLAGTLPQAPSMGRQPAEAGQPIGSWEFARASLRAHIDGADVIVDDASAEVEGVRWEVSTARLTPGSASRTRINAELRARRLDDSARAKAVLGMLPRATENPDGWRRYRISGTVDAPRIVGLK